MWVFRARYGWNCETKNKSNIKKSTDDKEQERKQGSFGKQAHSAFRTRYGWNCKTKIKAISKNQPTTKSRNGNKEALENKHIPHSALRIPHLIGRLSL